MRRYEGIRPDDGDAIVRVLEDDRPPRDLGWQLGVRNHSPTGLEWGYPGSGPAQLALALCVDALDGDAPRATRVYMEFKWQVTARLEGARWLLSQDEVLETIHAIEAAKDRLARSDSTVGAPAA